MAATTVNYLSKDGLTTLVGQIKEKYYNKTSVDSMISAVNSFNYEVVATLPTASADTMHKIYLVADAHATGDSYDEFLTLKSGDAEPYTYAWEKIGNTDVDLSGYVQKETGKSLVSDTEITKLAGVSTGANKVESSDNGYIAIDGTKTKVYEPATGTVVDTDYAHITVTASSVSDGTTTFTKYDDTALAARVAELEDDTWTAITTKEITDLFA